MLLACVVLAGCASPQGTVRITVGADSPVGGYDVTVRSHGTARSVSVRRGQTTSVEHLPLGDVSIDARDLCELTTRLSSSHLVVTASLHQDACTIA